MNEDDEFLLKQCHSIATSSPDFAGVCDADAVRKSLSVFTFANTADQNVCSLAQNLFIVAFEICFLE